ncbi:hypothetical protein LE190_02435 [Massilia oculi]|uniref:Uncharacterized protein n=1 Tax=Massilia hydrophila TaxID=3044279 RepID=A0ABS7Y6S1_9BURK|nr:hypothetical protein [Massilia oculi]MCA1854787.1 hypothetical protein [Massilia oculi]
MKRFSTAAALLALALPSTAQETAAPGPVAAETVQVSSIKDPALQPYRRMLRGLDAWDKQRALAPQASLRFELWTADGHPAPVEGLQLRIAGERVDIALPLDAEGSFALPRSQEADEDDADLISNRRKDQLRWRPRVRTPGLPGNVRRLGDLRMECAVSMAIGKEEVPLLFRAAALAAGGLCRLPQVAYQYRTPRPVASATLVSGERREALRLYRNGREIVAPLRDSSWDDETLIVYAFASDQP